MSEKEQAQALRLLREMLQYAAAGKVPPWDLVEKASRFLLLEPPPAPESHGQRRS